MLSFVPIENSLVDWGLLLVPVDRVEIVAVTFAGYHCPILVSENKVWDISTHSKLTICSEELSLNS